MGVGTVLCVGCFDLLHPGHVLLLYSAAAYGDRLIVGLTVDEAVHKGSGHPLFNWDERRTMLRHLKWVEDVIPNHSAEQTIKEIQPEWYAKGIEYFGSLPEERLVKSYGGRVVYIDTHYKFSSTDIMTGRLFAQRKRTVRPRVK